MCTRSIILTWRTPPFLSQVRIKMQQDEVPEHMIRIYCEDEDEQERARSATTGAETGGVPGTDAKGGYRRSRRRNTTVTLRKLHWNALAADRIEKSVFASKALGEGMSEVDSRDVELLEKMFAEHKTAAKGKKEGGGNKTKKVTILDQKRSNAIAIGLSQFKRQNGDCRAIARAVLYDEPGSFDAGSLETLHDMLPTSHETKRLVGYRGDTSLLGNAEQFCLGVMEYVIIRAFHLII